MKKPLSKELIFIISFFSGVAIICAGIFIGIALFGTKHKPEPAPHSVVQTPPEPTTDDISAYSTTDTNAVAEPTTANSSVFIDDNLQYEFNIFMSNFSEASINSFSERLSNEELIEFGLMHNHLNKSDKTMVPADRYIDVPGTSYHSYHKLNYKYVIETVKKYFGITLSKNDFSDHDFYIDDYVYCVCTGGYMSGGFSVVNNVKSLGNDLYSLTFDIYDDGMGNLDKELYKKSPSDVTDSSYRKIGTGSAVISIDDLYDRSTFFLKSYNVTRY